MTVLWALGAAGIVAYVGLGGRYGFPAAATCMFLLATALVPKSLTAAISVSHAGIAPPSATISTYLLATGALALVVALSVIYRGDVKEVLPITALLFVAFFAAEIAFAWNRTDEQVAGAIELLMGIGAWIAGAFLARRTLIDRRAVRAIAGTILSIASIQAIVAVAQRVGVPINPMDPATAALMGERTNGLLNHPGNLGKICLILLILALGLLHTSDLRSRRMLWMTLGVIVVPFGLSQGRANLIAALLTIVFWALLTRQGKATVRLGVPLLAVIAVLPFLGSFIERMQDDPDGGPRADLSATAIEQIGMRPWFGTGPNSYVSVVSHFDPIVAQGFPVHNVYLLTAAELGVIAAVLFWLPVALLVASCWRARKRGGYSGSFATALIAAVPGFYVVTATGWAMLSLSLLPLWFFLLGTVYAAIRLPAAEAAAQRYEDAAGVHRVAARPGRAAVHGAHAGTPGRACQDEARPMAVYWPLPRDVD